MARTASTMSPIAAARLWPRSITGIDLVLGLRARVFRAMPAGPLLVLRRPFLEVDDVVADIATMPAKARSGARPAHSFERAAGQADIEGGLSGGEKWLLFLASAARSVSSSMANLLVAGIGGDRVCDGAESKDARTRDGEGRTKSTTHEFVHPSKAKEAPRQGAGRGSQASIGWIPDDGEHVLVVLAGGAAEIGVELARPKFGRCEAQRDVSLPEVSPLRTQPAPISTPWVNTRKSGWLSALLAALGTRSMSARIVRVLSWPLKPPLACL